MCDDPLDAQASVDWPVTLLPALQERINAWLANDFDAAIKETPAPATHNPIVAIEKDDVTIYDPIRNVSEVG